MTGTGKCRNFQADNVWPRRAFPCLVRVSIYQIPLRASRAPKICRRQRSFGAVAIIRSFPVRGAVSRVFEIAPAAACCMTWVTSSLAGPATSNWFTRSTAARNATASSTRTPPSTRCPSPTIRIASFRWQCGWSSRMACRIKPPVGTCGAIIGCLSPSLRSKIGWKALTFLDDKLLPSTSNAVERGNRRHRKMQKSVYRVRTQEHIHNRIALDMIRDSQRDDRTNTLKTLHRKRANAA
jgi:hypothetical protein